jgi:hypothetical protein
MLKFRKRSDKAKLRRLRLAVEGLEDRVTPTTFKVNTLLDTVAVNLKTGKDASGHISLRSAIMAADANPNSDTINLPAGLITLTIAPSGTDGSSSGDLDISGNVTIKGSSSGQTIINGNSLDRVFAITSGRVSISNVVIEHGVATDGGGIVNDGATVTLTSVQLFDNNAVGFLGSNGANGAAGPVVGSAGGGGGLGGLGVGGAIFNAAGSLTLSKCFISTNAAIGGPGGAGGNGGFGGNINSAGVSGVGGSGGAGGPGGAAEGGGIFNSALGSLTLVGDTFFANKALGGAGGNGGGGNIGAGGVGANGTGGAGGVGGAGGLAEGGAILNLGKLTFSSSSTGFNSNQAVGGKGGNGGFGDNGAGGPGVNAASGVDGGGAAGEAIGGTGGAGGAGGAGEGGAVFNSAGASLSSTTAVLLFSNTAAGNLGGNGGAGGFGNANTGGAGGNLGGNGGGGGVAVAGNGGAGGNGGVGEGGGMFNAAGATVTFTSKSPSGASIVSAFTSNLANGGGGGSGGPGGNAFGGPGGNAGRDGIAGGHGGAATGGTGGNGGSANSGLGGGLFNVGTASFTGVTVNFTSNQANGAFGGSGGTGGLSVAGNGGGITLGGADPSVGGNGGNSFGGTGGNGGESGIGQGGGIFVATSGTFTLKPRLGARKGTKEASATDVITGNHANASPAGNPGHGGSATAGTGGSPHGARGGATAGNNGTVDTFSVGIGGGIAIIGTAIIDNTSISGNHATTADPDVDGTFSS